MTSHGKNLKYVPKNIAIESNENSKGENSTVIELLLKSLMSQIENLNEKVTLQNKRIDILEHNKNELEAKLDNQGKELQQVIDSKVAYELYINQVKKEREAFEDNQIRRIREVYEKKIVEENKKIINDYNELKEKYYGLTDNLVKITPLLESLTNRK